MFSPHPFLIGRALRVTSIFMSVGPLQAQLVAYDGFEAYPAGVQVESGPNGSSGTKLDAGIGWGTPYNVNDFIKSLVLIEDRTLSPVDYINGDIVILGGTRALRFYDIANGTYAVRRRLGTAFDATAGETLWFSFLFRTASNSPMAEQDFFQVGFDDNGNASSGSPRVSIGANTSSASFPSDFQFFARSTTETTESAFASGVSIAAATTYLLVGRIRPHAGVYDEVSLFVNPTTLDDPGPASASITLPSGLSSLSHAFIRTHYLDNGDAYVIDEWHIGRDYGSVVQSLSNALTILPAALPGGAPTLRWSAALTGVQLETSTTLAPDSWSAVIGPFPLTGGDHEYPVVIAPEFPRRFFRLSR